MPKQIYDQPVRILMREMVTSRGYQPGQVFERDEVLGWFADKYPMVKQGTILAHLIRMSTNVPSRLNYTARPDDDLFFRLDPRRFRLYQPDIDPNPIVSIEDVPAPDETHEITEGERSQFAYEKDLQNFIARNLSMLEPGLKLYEEEGITGLEFPAGGRFIDILARDGRGDYVVIELKVSKGYDRVVGQLLRYMEWIERNHAEPGQGVRGIIIAKEVSEDLSLACARVKGVTLYEYDLSVSIRKV